MGIAYNTSIVRSGLVLHLDAANPKSYLGSGTTWNDLSGRKNNGTIVGAPTYTAQGLSLNLDLGFSQFITVPLSPFQFGLSNFTLSSWVYPRSAGTPALFGVSANVTASRYAVGYAYNTGADSYFFAFARDDNSNTVQFNSAIIPNNVWYNVVMTVNRSSLVSLYVNNILVNSAASNFNTIISPQGQAGIGFVVNGGNPGLNGISASTLVYNRDLSVTEINQNFEAMRGRYGI